MSNIKRIFIIGHSGAGKSVLAQAVAKKLGWKFINADILGCVAHIGRNVSEVVGTEGERAFNRCLTEILSHQITQKNIVVTTDESIICDAKARELLKSEFCVYLKVSTAVQLDRISEGDCRPLLPVDNFTALLDKIHDERDGLYEQVASFSLSSDNGDIERHATSIINTMEDNH
jgi:shikimate kinase